MNETGRPLTSPVYLSALTLLVANDWLLKPALHNGLTGKLSDFAGLFALTWFGVVLLPRWRWLLSIAVVIAFVYWKSPHSNAFIAAWNGLHLFPIGRVVDPSDCVALAMVPVAYVHASKAKVNVRRPITRLAVAAISVVAFTGTSFHNEYKYDQSYDFSMSAGELRHRLTWIALHSHEVAPIGILEPEEIEIGLPGDTCDPHSATVRIDETPRGASLRLIEIVSVCPPEKGDRQRFLQMFEARIVDKIEPDP
ncbi:MAG TPA: hypothetical protein VJ982_05340 [Gemmatimonadota bacterium]|nr:hypothetical protein [Gemmatimonadota bacterium]